MKSFTQEKVQGTRTTKDFANSRVSRSPRPVFDPSVNAPPLFRTPSCPCGGGCGLCRGKSGDETASQTLSAVTSPQKTTAHPTPCPAEKVPSIVQNVLQSPGERLDSRMQTVLGPKFDLDLGKVKIHTGSAAAQSAKSVNAAAFTVGKNIVFNEGRSEDRSLMEHELGHVKEQWSSSEPVMQCRKDPSTVLQDSEIASMNVQMEEIRRWIAAGSLSRTQEKVIISHISSWYEKDSALGGNTPYLDKFLFLLQTNTATQHHGLGETFGYDEIRLISDALWHDLDDEFLQQYKDLAAKSQSQKTTGPNFARGDGALKTIAKQEAIGMTAAVKGLSTGLAGVAGRGAAEYVGKNFDELGELMFDKEWSNGESLFLGLSAKDIGEFGGGVIWDLVMMSKGGAVNTIDKIQKGMAKVNAAQSIVLSVRDIDSILTRLGTPGPLTAERVLADPDFQKTTMSLAGEIFTAFSKDPLKSEKIRLILSGGETVALTRKLVLAYQEKGKGPEQEKAFGQALLEYIKQVVGLLRSSHQLAKHTQEAAQQKKASDQPPAKKPVAQSLQEDENPQKQVRKTMAAGEEHEEPSDDKVSGLVKPTRPKATLIKADCDTLEEAQHHYEEQLKVHGGKFEAAIFQDRRTGKYSVSLGNEVEVASAGSGDFRTVKHFHPNEFNAKQFRLPASADFKDSHDEYIKNGNRPVSEVVESPVPGKGMSRVEFGIDPTHDKKTPYFITVTMPGEKPTTMRFRTLEDLDAHKSDMGTTYVDPTKPLYWQMMGGGGGGEGKTMAGGAKTPSLPKQTPVQETETKPVPAPSKNKPSTKSKFSERELAILEYAKSNEQFRKLALEHPERALAEVEKHLEILKESGASASGFSNSEDVEMTDRQFTPHGDKGLPSDIAERTRTTRRRGGAVEWVDSGDPSTGLNRAVRGEGLAIPYDAHINKLLQKYGVDGIRFGDGHPDFSPVVARDTTGKDTSIDISKITYNRTANFQEAFQLFGKAWNMPPAQAEKYIKAAGWTIHETENGKKVQLVDSEIHKFFTHFGGVGEDSRATGMKEKDREWLEK